MHQSRTKTGTSIRAPRDPPLEKLASKFIWNQGIAVAVNHANRKWKSIKKKTNLKNEMPSFVRKNVSENFVCLMFLGVWKIARKFSKPDLSTKKNSSSHSERAIILLSLSFYIVTSFYFHDRQLD